MFTYTSHTSRGSSARFSNLPHSQNYGGRGHAPLNVIVLNAKTADREYIPCINLVNKMHK